MKKTKLLQVLKQLVIKLEKNLSYKKKKREKKKIKKSKIKRLRELGEFI